MQDWREYLTKNFYQKVKPGWRILDIGTGFLSNLELLIDTTSLKALIWSIDKNEKVLKNAERVFNKWIKKGILKLVKADATNLPFNNEFFDLTTSVMTLHHISNLNKAVSEMYRVTKLNRNIVVVDWNPKGEIYTPHDPKFLGEAKNNLLSILEDKNLKYEIKEFDFWYIINIKK